MDYMPCKIWSEDRSLKKTFMSIASIERILEKANSMGIYGNKIVLEADGSEICDDSVLQYYLRNDTILMVIKDIWLEANKNVNIEQPHHFNEEIDEVLVEEIVYIPQNDDIPTTSKNVSTTLTNDIVIVSEPNFNINKEHNLYKNNENEFLSFQIPWEKVPGDIMKMLEKKEKLSKRLNAFANVIVDELRLISKSIPMGTLRAVTQQAVNKYPDSFLETDNEGKIISHTTVSILTIMRNRNNFLNRAPKRNTNLDPTVPIKCKKRANVFQKTCVNWMPLDISLSETSSSLEYKKQHLLKLNGTTLNNENKETVRAFMVDCYATQRKFYNNMDPVPSIIKIKLEWPFIFKKECFNDHFKILVNLDSSIFTQNFKSSQHKILRFFKSLRNQTVTESANEEAIEFAILGAISAYFKEDITYLYKRFEFGITLDDIKKEVPTNTPFIAFIQHEFLEKAYIFVERELVLDDKFEIVEQINSAIQFYYIFNILYAHQISQTMEFLFRYFHKSYPSDSRGNKRNVNNIQKINSLIKKLSEFV